MATGTFAAAINCIDGRTIRPVLDHIQANHAVDFVDLITEPGPDKVLTQGAPDVIARIKANVLVSVQAHGSQVVAIAGHHGCAANDATEAEHRAMIEQAAQVVASWNMGARVIGLWVNELWQVEVVCDSGA